MCALLVSLGFSVYVIFFHWGLVRQFFDVEDNGVWSVILIPFGLCAVFCTAPCVLSLAAYSSRYLAPTVLWGCDACAIAALVIGELGSTGGSGAPTAEPPQTPHPTPPGIRRDDLPLPLAISYGLTGCALMAGILVAFGMCGYFRRCGCAGSFEEYQ